MSKKACCLIVAWIWISCVGLILIGCEKPIPTRDAVIAGGSMAPTFLGQHYQVTCSDCGYQFAFDSKLPADKKVVCPNCGFRGIRAENLEIQPADTAIVELMDLTKPGNIKRGDVVAFELPSAKTPVANKPVLVKRVVGLPGEKIQVRDGDIYVDGKLFRKSLELQKRTRIPVFDSKYSTADSKISPRLEMGVGSENWSGFVGAQKAYESPYDEEEKPVKFDWVTYRNWRCCRHDGRRDELLPVEDYYAFNQNTNRDLNPTDEVFVQLEMECEKEGAVFFAIPHLGVRYKFGLDFKRREATLFSSLEGVVEYRLDDRIRGSKNTVIEVSTIDHQLVVLVDGVQAFQHDVFHQASTAPVAKTPFALAFAKGESKISRVQVWRDIYYLNEGPFFAGDAEREFVAGENEVILLGDNSPVSSDSRHWENPAINTKQIIGKVVPN